MAIGSPQWMYKSGEAYTIDQSLKFEDGKSPKLTKTFASAGNRRTWTFSCWVKKNKVSGYHVLLGCGTTGDYEDLIYFDTTNNNFRFAFGDGTGNTRATAAYYRDTSAWMHVMVAVDSTQSTAADRIKMYVNGVLNTTWAASSNNDPAQNFDFRINTAAEHYIGVFSRISSHADFYLADMNFIDGQQLTPSDFGETGDYGEWKPVEYSGTYGNNGFYLPFKNDYTVEGFSTVTYKGTGASQYIGGTGFRPSLTWIKQRSGTGWHNLGDIVRGNGLGLYPNDTAAEGGGLDVNISAYAPDGFVVGTGGAVNTNGSTNVAWNWDMGANTPTGFSAITSTGNATARSLANVGFSPDLVWNKTRSANQNNFVYDRIRGAGKELRTNQASAEGTNDGVESFDPDGFSRGSSNDCNENGITYVDWCWDMGGTSATNTDGSITSTVMANPTYGQSIVKYTGTGSNATIGHGLSSAPEMIIFKETNVADNWSVYHTGVGNTGKLRLNGTNATITGSTIFNNTSPTSSVFTTGTDGELNGEMIAYCFHSVSGYSKFGSYTGSGGSGNAQTLGFRPAFVMIKKTSGTDNWAIIDSTRNPLNPIDKSLRANTSDVENDLSTNYQIDFTDTGFTFNNYGYNDSGASYIYMAFAGGMDSISDYNTDGSSDSRVKANTTYGQSIVTYTGQSGAQTIGHGLDSAPEVIMVKNRSVTNEWRVYHAATPGGGAYNAEQYSFRLDTDDVEADSTYWNDTAPTSSVFSVGDNQVVNSGHGNDYVAYCWHSVTGYSKFNRYSGNGTTTNAITTGFEPAFVMLKRTDTANDWIIIDNVRADVSGTDDNELHANSTAAEQNDERLDFTSTGFTLKSSAAAVNASGGTYIYMAFADKREYAYWLDQSGNNNDWTSNNLTESDISVDSPTNNFCTWNPLARRHDVTTLPAMAEGNLQVTGASAGGNGTYGLGTIGVSSGKWYFEVYCKNDAGTGFIVGISDDNHLGSGTNSAMIGYRENGEAYSNGGSSASYGATYTTGDIIGCAFDVDNKTVQFFKNGVSQGTLSSLTINTVSPFQQINTNDVSILNAGQDSSFAGNKTAQGNQDSNDIGDFYYEPPTGFLALCTDNLPNVAVTPSEHFNTVTYSGTGSTQSITVGFQPDFTWFKSRSANRAHVLVDAVRGVTKELIANSTGAEQTSSATQDLTAFTSTGFDLGTVYNNSPNESGASIVAWNWKANGSGSSNTDGSLTATVSANVDAGFSIIKYTGTGSATDFGHGLSKKPELVIVKNRDAAEQWMIDSSQITGNAGGTLMFNTDAEYVASNQFDVPTASLIKIKTAGNVNVSGQDFICYAFHSVDGYSKVGSYTGNGNADGTFVYTGFRPTYVLCKQSSSGANGWQIIDGTRSPYNVTSERLLANLTNAEQTNVTPYDFTSNGFKLRTTDSSFNQDGETYVYLAFAETPFKYSNAR